MRGGKREKKVQEERPVRGRWCKEGKRVMRKRSEGKGAKREKKGKGREEIERSVSNVISQKLEVIKKLRIAIHLIIR